MTRQHEAGREEAQWEPGTRTCSQRATQEPTWTGMIETETKEEMEKEKSTTRDDDDDDHRTPVQAHECAHEG